MKASRSWTDKGHSSRGPLFILFQCTLQNSIARIVADVTDKKSIVTLVEEIERKEGKLHILVNK